MVIDVYKLMRDDTLLYNRYVPNSIGFKFNFFEELIGPWQLYRNGYLVLELKEDGYVYAYS